MRNFDSGATRDTDEGKLDFEGFLSPLVIKRYAEYMHENRVQADGKLRDSDNWQRGIPRGAYMKSGWRHFFDWWRWHRGRTDKIESILCALMFNVMGYLHELLKEESDDLPKVTCKTVTVAVIEPKEPIPPLTIKNLATNGKEK